MARKFVSDSSIVIPAGTVTGTVFYGSTLFPTDLYTVPVDSIPVPVVCTACGDNADQTATCINDSDFCVDCCECVDCESCEKHGIFDKCDNCDYCESCCNCATCISCECKVGHYDFCSDCDYCSDCGCQCESDDDCDCEDCQPSGKGQRTVPGWVARGVKAELPHYSERESANIDQFLAIEPVSAMADFYLLSRMEFDPIFSDGLSMRWGLDPAYGAALSSLCLDAKAMKAALVETLDPVFRYYVNIAVGGELRHHRAVQMSVGLSSSRKTSWGEWVAIQAAIGPDAFTDAADMFEEMSGGYGGDPWATAARILHMRETGVLPPWAFVDRVFTLQHNNGSLLNKVAWADFAGPIRLDNPLQFMQIVGNAHAAQVTDLSTLALVATKPVQALFRQWWTARNKVLVSSNLRPELFPQPLKGKSYYGDPTIKIKNTLGGYTPYALKTTTIAKPSKPYVPTIEQWADDVPEAQVVVSEDWKSSTVNESSDSFVGCDCDFCKSSLSGKILTVQEQAEVSSGTVDLAIKIATQSGWNSISYFGKGLIIKADPKLAATLQDAAIAASLAKVPGKVA